MPNEEEAGRRIFAMLGGSNTNPPTSMTSEKASDIAQLTGRPGMKMLRHAWLSAALRVAIAGATRPAVTAGVPTKTEWIATR